MSANRIAPSACTSTAAVTRVPVTGAAAATAAATSFYAAFARRDAAGMEAAYAPNVAFHDPLFGRLDGKSEVMQMWKTILPAANPKTFQLEARVQPHPKQRPDGTFEVKVQWDAHYDLGKRHVDNRSDTTLLVRNGKIVEQNDDWNLSAWTKQALPFGGGHPLVDALTAFAAHTFVEVKDVFER